MAFLKKIFANSTLNYLRKCLFNWWTCIGSILTSADFGFVFDRFDTAQRAFRFGLKNSNVM